MSRREKTGKDYKITEIAERIKTSGIDRRTFLMHMAIAGLAVSIPVTRCTPAEKDSLSLERNPEVLTEKEWDILKVVQEHLFPAEPGSPGASDVNAAAFVQWILLDKTIDKREQVFLKDGLNDLDDEAKERWSKPFLDMRPQNQVKLLQHIESHDWGESWLSVMLMYIFEALLSDPVYGANINQAGWQWLGYGAGEPRPEYIYSEVVKKVK